MKLRRKRASEVPPKIKSFINSVTAVPLEQIQEPLACFRWELDKGDFHHWVDLFNHLDTYFEKHVKGRKDLHIDETFEESTPFPKDDVLQVLRVIRVVLENCTNKHFYSSYEQHLSLLLASTDADVVEACLQTLAAFLKRQVGKYSIRDASLISKLFSLAQGWGGKEEGLGLTSCATENTCDQVSHQLEVRCKALAMDPYLKEERREMKRLQKYCDMLGYVADAQYGIPTCCPCGERIVDEVSAKECVDTHPGKRFFTCKKYKDDGLHFRQSWVVGVEEEISKVTRRVEEVENLTWKMEAMNLEIKKLKDAVEMLSRQVAELQKLPLRESET